MSNDSGTIVTAIVGWVERSETHHSRAE